MSSVFWVQHATYNCGLPAHRLCRSAGGGERAGAGRGLEGSADGEGGHAAVEVGESGVLSSNLWYVRPEESQYLQAIAAARLAVEVRFVRDEAFEENEKDGDGRDETGNESDQGEIVKDAEVGGREIRGGEADPGEDGGNDAGEGKEHAAHANRDLSEANEDLAQRGFGMRRDWQQEVGQRGLGPRLSACAE